MPTKKEASEKQQAAEGVAVRINTKPDHYPDGIPVRVPADASDSETKPGQSAESTKE